jgi:hypothetical protein
MKKSIFATLALGLVLFSGAASAHINPKEPPSTPATEQPAKPTPAKKRFDVHFVSHDPQTGDSVSDYIEEGDSVEQVRAAVQQKNPNAKCLTVTAKE